MPNDDPARTADELATVISQLARRLRAASSEGSLTPSQLSVMGRLLHEGSATTAALARDEIVRPQSMRMTLAALEDQGLVARAPHPTDGRQVVFTLTEAGRHLHATGRQARRGWLAEALAGELTPEERQALTEAVALLRRVVQS